MCLGDTSKVAAVAVEVVSLYFYGGKILVLKDCLYVPNVRRNLISDSCLACNRFSTIFNKNIISIKYGVDEISCEMLADNLYINQYLTYKLIHMNLIIREKNHPQLTKPNFGT